jgi:hypothetical protein
LAPVRLLKRGKTAHIKWLQEVRQVRRHTYSDNLVISAVLLEIQRIVALMAVNNQQTVATNSMRLYMRVKVL